jgi:hypothetical protein
MYESHINMILKNYNGWFFSLYLCVSYVFRQHKTMENGIHTIIIAKSWPIKFVMTFLISCTNFHYQLLLEFMSQEKNPSCSNPKWCETQEIKNNLKSSILAIMNIKLMERKKFKKKI